VRSVKDEALSRLILFGEASLRHALHEYVEHYHHERNHQGKGNVLLFPLSSQQAWMTAQCSVVNGLADCSNTTSARPHEFFAHTGAGRTAAPCVWE
jgi:site-specific recombinase XerD